jgi:hypothetical protein
VDVMSRVVLYGTSFRVCWKLPPREDVLYSPQVVVVLVVLILILIDKDGCHDSHSAQFRRTVRPCPRFATVCAGYYAVWRRNSNQHNNQHGNQHNHYDLADITIEDTLR